MSESEAAPLGAALLAFLAGAGLEAGALAGAAAGALLAAGVAAAAAGADAPESLVVSPLLLWLFLVAPASLLAADLSDASAVSAAFFLDLDFLLVESEVAAV